MFSRSQWKTDVRNEVSFMEKGRETRLQCVIKDSGQGEPLWLQATQIGRLKGEGKAEKIIAKIKVAGTSASKVTGCQGWCWMLSGQVLGLWETFTLTNIPKGKLTLITTGWRSIKQSVSWKKVSQLWVQYRLEKGSQYSSYPTGTDKAYLSHSTRVFLSGKHILAIWN